MMAVLCVFLNHPMVGLGSASRLAMHKETMILTKDPEKIFCGFGHAGRPAAVVRLSMSRGTRWVGLFSASAWDRIPLP